MPPAARLGDMHTCPMVTPGTPPVPHVGGPILPPCCPTVIIGGLPAARVGDMAICVGPPDVIVKGSPTVLIGFMPAARIGDLTAHGGVIVMGCPTVIIGEVGAGAPVGPGTPGSGAPPATSQGGGQTSDVSHIGPAGPEHVGPLKARPGHTPAKVESSSSRQQREEEKTWIEVELVDLDGESVPNKDFRIQLSKGRVLSGRTNRQGKARFEGVDPDSGEVIFPQIPEDAEPSGATKGYDSAQAPEAVSISASTGQQREAPELKFEDAAPGEWGVPPDAVDEPAESAGSGEEELEESEDAE